MQVKDVDDNQMLTTAQAAILLGLKAATLSNWREDGSADLAFSKFGRSVRYRYADVVAFALARRCTSTLGAKHLKRKPAVETQPPSGKPVPGKGKPAPSKGRASPSRMSDKARAHQLDLLDLVER